MTNANFERFDGAGNSYGMISVAIRSIADRLEYEQVPVGFMDVLGTMVTEESNAADAKLTRERMAGLMVKLAAELRAY